MLDKLLKAFGLIKKDVSALQESVAKLEKVRPVVKEGKPGRDGRDGVSPSVEDIVEAVIAQLPAPEKVDTKAIASDVLAQVPKPRDGRDAPTVNVSDVAAIVMAKIPKPKDGKDGHNGPDLETVVKRVKAQVQDGKQGEAGPRGPKGPPGKDGVSITDVQLNNSDLFVFLDGKRKKVGSIKVPTPTAPFNPGNTGGGGSARIEGSRDNAVYVSKASDFPVQDNESITLQSGVIYIAIASFQTEKYFNCEDRSFITGRNIDAYTISYSGTGDMFRGVDADFGIQQLQIDCPSAQAFNFVDQVGGQKRFILNTVEVVSCSKWGTFEDMSLTELINTGGFDNDQGIELRGTNGVTLSISRLSMASTSALFKGLDFGSSQFQIIEVDNYIAIAPPGAFALAGQANSGNVPTGRRAMVSNCEFSGGLTPLENIASNDVRWEFQNNVGIQDSRNAVDAYLTGGAETVDIITAGVFEEIGAPVSPGVSWASDIQDRFTVGNDGVVTYVGEKPVQGQLVGTATVQKVGGGSDELEVRFAKNWAPGQTGIEKSRAITQNATPTSVPIAALVDINPDDNFRVIVRNNSNPTDVIIEVTSFDIIA